jgi:hypothetical protein
MTTMVEDPLAPASAHFALARPRRVSPAARGIAAPVCPRGLRDILPAPTVEPLPEHTFDHRCSSPSTQMGSR